MLLKQTIKQVIDAVAPSILYNKFIKEMTKKEQEIKLLPLVCNKNATAVDIGANRGLYVHHLLDITKDVIAFEPLPPMQKVLRRNYGDRIRLEPVALSSAPGMAELRFPEGNYSWATLAASNDLSLRDQGQKIVTKNVDVRTLDSFSFQNISLIKIDVEGHEEAVLTGGIETLKLNKPSLIIEIEERHNQGSTSRIFKMLKDMQYRGFYIWDRELKSIDEFDSVRDQSIQNVGIAGKSGRYINNFIFFPNELPNDVISTANKLIAA